MDNAKKNKTDIALYIVLALIIATVVCMTVFSVASKRKTQNVPEAKPTEPSVTQPVLAPESSEAPQVMLPEETEETPVIEPEETEAQKVDSEVRLTYKHPVEGYLLKGFDIDTPVYSLTMNDYRVHKGIDIEADYGAEVVAMAEGVVESVYEDPMMGNCISVSHPNGITSFYMGLSDEVCEGVKEGAPVYCGQKLSSIGDSTLVELSEVPHLHFEIHRDGEYINPLNYVSYQWNTSDEAISHSYED